MAFPAALKEKEEEVREGEADMKKAKKSKGKKKKDTEIEKGPVGSEGVTKANRSSMPSLDAGDFKADGCGCSKKDAAKADMGCSKKKDGGKKKSVWADGFAVNDAAFVLSQGADKLATEKYAREKRKRNAQGQPHNMIYANTYNT